MYEKVSFEIEGVAPLLMHNGQLADPLNPFVREMKKITAKGRKKTDHDLEELARLEFCGGLYAGENGEPVIPGELIEATLRDAARKSRNGKDALCGIISDGNWPLVFDGPKTAEKLWKEPRFRDTRGAGVNRARVMRTRPRFDAWKLSFEVMYLPDVVNRGQVVEWCERAGRDVGLCDYRPRFGRFVVNSHS